MTSIVVSEYSNRVQLAQLANQHRQMGIAVEIGTYAGDYAWAIVNSGWKGKLICVDPFIPFYDPSDPAAYGLEAAKQIWLDRFRNNNNVELWEMTSVEAALSWKKRNNPLIDWIYIDGDHRPLSVLTDLVSWYPLVRVGGIISGHDFINSEEFKWTSNVGKAILGFCNIMEIEKIHVIPEDKIWSFYFFKQK